MSIYKKIQVDIPSSGAIIKSSGYVEYYLKGTWIKEKGYALNKRVVIGLSINNTKMNPNDKYYEIFNLPSPRVIPTTSRIVKDVGDFVLLNKIISDLKLDVIMKEHFTDDVVRNVLTVVHRILVSGSNVMLGINDWCDKTLSYVKYMSDNDASKTFSSINQGLIFDFFDSWIRIINEKECVFYDSTSNSSYSETINLFDYGYNKDNDGLQTIGIALFVGKKTKMPLYYEVYNGSINDKKQLQTMIAKALGFGLDCKRFVMDRGYYSKNNVQFIHDLGKKYTVCLQTGFLFVQEFIANNPNLDKDIGNHTNIADIYGKKLFYQKYGDVYLYYSNTRKENDIKKMNNSFNSISLKLKENTPLSLTDKRFLETYADITVDNEGVIVSFTKNNDKINEQMLLFGYFAFMSNDNMTPAELLAEYSLRECDEQFFDAYKNQLDYFRTKTHNRETLIGKIFVGFIGLIIKMKMDIILKNHKEKYANSSSKEKSKMINLHNYDNKKLFYLLSAIRGCNLSSEHLEIIAPITKKQSQVLELYGISEKELSNTLKDIKIDSMW